MPSKQIFLEGFFIVSPITQPWVEVSKFIEFMFSQEAEKFMLSQEA